MSCPHRRSSAGERGSVLSPHFPAGKAPVALAQGWQLTGTQLAADSRRAPLREGSAPAPLRPPASSHALHPLPGILPSFRKHLLIFGPNGGSFKRLFSHGVPPGSSPSPLPPSLRVQRGLPCCWFFFFWLVVRARHAARNVASSPEHRGKSLGSTSGTKAASGHPKNVSSAPP